MYSADVWSEEAIATSRLPLWVCGDPGQEKNRCREGLKGILLGGSWPWARTWGAPVTSNLCKGWSKGVWGSTWNPRSSSQKHPGVIPSSTLTPAHPLRGADCTHTVWGRWVACDRLFLLTSLAEQTHVGKGGSCFGGLWPRILGCGQDWVCQGEELSSTVSQRKRLTGFQNFREQN